ARSGRGADGEGDPRGLVSRARRGQGGGGMSRNDTRGRCLLMAALGLALASAPLAVSRADDKPVEELPKPKALEFAAKPAAPLYAGGEPMPIDLPTTLRLAEAANPTIALARAR